MDCTTALTSIGIYLDGELADRQIAALEDHLRSCDRCRMELRLEQDRSAAIRRHASYYRAPPALAARVGLAIPAPEPTTSARRPWAADRRLRWAAIAASWLIAVTLSAGLTWYAAVPGHHAQVAAEVIAAHQRSLLGDHLTDIASSDPGVVVPWFKGKVAAMPPAADFAAAGYADVRPSYGSVLLPLFEQDGLRMGELARRAQALEHRSPVFKVRLIPLALPSLPGQCAHPVPPMRRRVRQMQGVGKSRPHDAVAMSRQFHTQPEARHTRCWRGTTF